MPESMPAAEPDFAAFIAIDWADREHTYVLQVKDESRREKGKFEHTPQAIADWALQLAARFPGRRLAVALEQRRGALFYALCQYDHLVLYPVHPSTSYEYRKAIYPSGSKSDPQDADMLLDLLVLHRNRLRVVEPDTEPTRKLQLLVEKRRQMVDLRTAQTNRITDQLKLYFPQILDWFDNLSAPIVAGFLRRWPTLEDLQKEAPEAIRSFFHEHGSRSAKRIEQRLREIAQATAPTRDSAIIEPAVIVVRTMLDTVTALREGIRQFDKAISQTAGSHPDYAIFASFPGAGPAMAPRLLAAFGSQRERYSSATQMQTFSGIAPVMAASGKQCWIHFRWSCPKFLRQTFHEYAALSMQSCDWAREFYQRQKARGKTHHAAVRSLAFKWIRILFRCWKSRQTYHDQLYEAARKTRAVPLSRTPGPQLTTASPTALTTTGGKPQHHGMEKIGDLLKSILAQP
jgi:transposase